MAEAVVAVFADEGEPRRFVDATRSHQHVVRPEDHPAIAHGSREVDAFADQPAADAVPAGLRIDEEATELGHRRVLLVAHDEDATHSLAVELGDPEPLELGIMLAPESSK